jgi:CheY-like chemotaxis protein/HPt (histidine-containing phosphotransfer) domain-containing protein
VLLVEDNEINRAVALGFLTRLGYRADTAVHGRQALDLLAQRDYDAVLMDCQMPVVDGYTATRRLREREQQSGRHTPVIALTADVLAEAREQCFAAGMDDYVSKPLSRDALADALARWVGAGENSQTADECPELRRTVQPPSRPQPLIQSIRQRIQEISGDDSEAGRELLVRVSVMFVKSGEAALDELTAAAQRDDAAAVQAEAHRFKGSAGNIGAVALSALCGQLETLGRDRRLDGVGELLLRARAEFEACRTALARLTER